ncbi:DUF2059 domain-containing protein [Arenibacterium sp. CAU 1754]
MLRLPRLTLVVTAFLVCALFLSLAATRGSAADRARIEAFLNVTGFDVALDSIAFSAASAPKMLGMQPDAFGADWKRVSEEVFDTPTMRKIALDILEETLSDDMLGHAAGFYASDLGQRLVAAENESHMIEDDAEKNKKGQAIVSDLVSEGSDRIEIIKRMQKAIDVSGSSVRALQEVQVRFLLAASAAGVVDLKVDADELRALLKAQEGQLRMAIQQSALAGAAFTYQEFSDAELTDYAKALEQPLMMRVYELLNAVQYEIMANRFEILATRMADLHPGQDI